MVINKNDYQLCKNYSNLLKFKFNMNFLILFLYLNYNFLKIVYYNLKM